MPPGPDTAPSAAGERVHVRANVAIRTTQTLHFGRLLWVSGARLLVQLEQPLATNEPLDLRVDLSPLPGTALVKAVVARELPRVDGEMPKYLVRLVDVALDDRPRWLTWLDEKRAGGTLSHVSELTAQQSPLQSGYVNVAAVERAAALDRMKARTSSNSSPSSSASWITSDVREAASGRAAMRDALKSAIRKSAENEPPGRVLATVSPAAAPRPPIVERVATPTPAVPTRRDPEWTVSQVKGNTYVEVRWISAEVFSYDVHSQLVGLTLTLQPGTGAFPRQVPIHMFLRHDPVMIQCEALPLFVQDDHASYRLALTPVHIAELRRFSRPLSIDQSLAVERGRRR